MVQHSDDYAQKLRQLLVCLGVLQRLQSTATGLCKRVLRVFNALAYDIMIKTYKNIGKIRLVNFQVLFCR